jgi:hypothetical protein
MIFQKTKYGTILPISDIPSAAYCESLVEEAFIDPPNNTGGLSKIKDMIINLKNKALDALGLNDKEKTKSIIIRMKDTLSSLIAKARDGAKAILPKFKEGLDSLCNYILDAIDYLKKELS